MSQPVDQRQQSDAPSGPYAAGPDAAGPDAAEVAPPALAPSATPVREVCPLCGAPLRVEQDWCMRCGAAARTRLAAPPKWKLLVALLATIALLSLGVLIAALLELAG